MIRAAPQLVGWVPNSIHHAAEESSWQPLDLVPDPAIVISGARELEHLKAERLRTGKFVT